MFIICICFGCNLNGDLKKIISEFMSTGGYSLEIEKVRDYSILEELLNNGSLKTRSVPGFAIDTKTFEMVESEQILVDITDKFFDNYADEIELICTWDEKLFLRNLSPLAPVFLNPRLFQMIKSDPKYYCKWNGCRGELCSNDEKSTIDPYVHHLCLAYDLKDDVPILMMFLDDLLKMNESDKGLIRPFILEGEMGRYQLCVQNRKNLIEGDWYSAEETPIYDVVLQGIVILNELTKVKFGVNLFKTIETEYQHYRSILYPTKENYMLFIADLAVMLVENIDKDSIVEYIWTNKDRFSDGIVADKIKQNLPQIFDKKTELKKVGSISLLELLFEEYPTITAIIKPMKLLWDERSKIDHTVREDEYNLSYYELQDDWMISIYRMLSELIHSLDPDRVVCASLDSFQYYNSQYGINGAVGVECGFNRMRRIIDRVDDSII